MLKSAVGSVLNNQHVSAFRGYSAGGSLMAAGLEPTMVGDGFTSYEGYNVGYKRTAGSIVPEMQGMLDDTFMGKAKGIGFSAIGPAATLYTMYSGYQENGIAGVKDALVLELAATSAASRFAYGAVGTSGPSANIGLMQRLKNIGAKPAGQKVVFGGGAGMGAGIARTMGGAIGASIGQSVLGTPGAFIGGFIGAAPLRFAATHPLLAGGMALAGVAAVGTAAVVKGGGAVLRAGAEHRRRQRGIDTSGSMAAFMTQNAQTMRARAVQAMHKSHLNARSALGQEASFMHMPSRNYHSRYR